MFLESRSNGTGNLWEIPILSVLGIYGSYLINLLIVIIAGVITHLIAYLRYQNQTDGQSCTERQCLYYCFLDFHVIT